MRSYLTLALAAAVACVSGYVQLLWNSDLYQCLSGTVRVMSYISDSLDQCYVVTLSNGTVVGETQSGNETAFVLTNYANTDCTGNSEEYPVILDKGCSAYDGELSEIIQQSTDEIYIWGVNHSTADECCAARGENRTLSYIVSPNSDCSEASENYASVTVSFVEDTCTTKESIMNSVARTRAASSGIPDFVGNAKALKAAYYQGNLLMKLYTDTECETSYITTMWTSYGVDTCYTTTTDTSNSSVYHMFGCDGGSGCVNEDATTTTTTTVDQTSSVAEQSTSTTEEQTTVVTVEQSSSATEEQTTVVTEEQTVTEETSAEAEEQTTDSGAAGAAKGMSAVMAALVFVAAIVNVL